MLVTFAWAQGFGPQFTASKADVLPLDEAQIYFISHFFFPQNSQP